MFPSEPSAKSCFQILEQVSMQMLLPPLLLPCVTEALTEVYSSPSHVSRQKGAKGSTSRGRFTVCVHVLFRLLVTKNNGILPNCPLLVHKKAAFF